MSIVIVATITPRAEHRPEVIALFEEVIARVHAEDEGCELYALHEGDEDLLMIEKWESEAALEAHGRGPALTDLRSRIRGLLLGDLAVRRLTPHPAGSHALGTL